MKVLFYLILPDIRNSIPMLRPLVLLIRVMLGRRLLWRNGGMILNGENWSTGRKKNLFHCYVLLLLQPLQIHYLKVLAFSTTPFHLTRSGVHFVQIFIFRIIKLPFISFSHLILGLLDIGLHSYNCFYHRIICHSLFQWYVVHHKSSMDWQEVTRVSRRGIDDKPPLSLWWLPFI